jgi:type II secretory pathway pseudopilin PulG
MTEVTQNQDKTMLIAGWVLAVLMPIVGFFVGLAATIRGYAKHGIAMMVVSVLVVIGASALVVHEATKESDEQMAQLSAQVDQASKDAQAGFEKATSDAATNPDDEAATADAGVDQTATKTPLKDRIIKRNSLTSMSFAKNIVKAYDEQGAGNVEVYSPVTGSTYTVTMREDGSTGDVTATGRNGIRVVFTSS